jgi:hypothetical protein
LKMFFQPQHPCWPPRYRFLSLNFILSFLHLLTCVYIIWVTPLSHLLPLGRTCSALLFSDFVEEKRKDSKKNMEFLLVWDKDSYTGRFFMLFPYTYVLQANLLHLYLTSSLLPSPLPILASASLRLLHSFLHSEHINHIQVFGFLLCVVSP